MKDLYSALVAAQAAVQPVGKASVNSHMKYKYASGDDVVAEARRALNGQGLAVFALSSTITETPYQWTDDQGVVQDDVQLRLHVTFRLVHSSGEHHDFEPFTVPIMPERGRPLDKAEAGARTYALSYFLRELLLIPRVDEGAKGGEVDPDSRDDRGYTPKRQKPSTATEPQKPAPQRPAAQAQPPRERPLEPAPAPAPAAPRRTLAEVIRAGVAKAEDLARQAGGEWPTWLAGELDRIGMVVLEPEQADEETRRRALAAIKEVVAKLEEQGQEAA